MRVFVAGSTGAVGKALLPQLVTAHHEVVALVHTPAKASEVEAAGATPTIADAFDRVALDAAIRNARPEVVIHQLTALANTSSFRRFDQDFATTNRMRTEVTDTLLAAARAVHARRFIAQSFCGWPYARAGSPVKSEDDPLDPDPPPTFRKSLAAIKYLENVIRNAGDIEAFALRYGFLYGPGTGFADRGPITEQVRHRRIPIVGDGAGVWSFLHVQDAARATVAALTGGTPGIYNVVDDEPAPIGQWLPYLARAIGAKPPHHLPVWLGLIALGEGGVSMMTRIRGGSNKKAKRELGWSPHYVTWRQGFEHGLA
jgi:nucleoside-diphosphate-sugar epimerase